MKKTFNINIAGIPFVIDEDAYNLLKEYLNTIEHAFHKVDGGTELVADIESRIAELFIQASEDGSPIITLADVEQVIERVGNPEEFVEDGALPEEEEEAITERHHIGKRLYRDPQNRVLGGVCAGLAWYFGCNVMWVRILFVVLTLFSYSTFAVIYLLLWLLVPEARTPMQRMEMMGEQPTMENIGKTVTGSFKEASEEILSNGAGFLLKAFAAIGVPILVALALILIGCVIFLMAWASASFFGTGMPWDQDDPWIGKLVFWGVVCGISGSIILGVPLLNLVRKGLNLSPFSNPTKRICNVLWGFCIIMAGVSIGMLVSNSISQEDYRKQQRDRLRETQLAEQEHYKNSIMSLPDEEIQKQIDDLNGRADLLNKQAEDMLISADSLCDIAKEMKRKAENNPDSHQYEHLAKKYEGESKSAKKKSEALQNQARKLSNKSEEIWEILIEKQENAIDAKVKSTGTSPAR